MRKVPLHRSNLHDPEWMAENRRPVVNLSVPGFPKRDLDAEPIDLDETSRRARIRDLRRKLNADPRRHKRRH